MTINKRLLPGWIATILLTIITSFWVMWSFGEMYYEAWGLPFHLVIRYLIPAAICMVLTVVCLFWPRIGGSILIVVGVWFGVWWLQLQFSRGLSDPFQIAITLFLSAGLSVIGLLFWYDWRLRRTDEPETAVHKNWFRRNLRWLIATGIPIGVALGATIGNVPILILRQDDGIRTARLIEGNGVRLIWAPEGPGWAKGGEEAGSNLAWNQIALYGLPPIGVDLKAKDANRHASQAEMDTFCLCRYLSDDGTILMDSAQNIWRMPTTQEVVRSLIHHGKHAGCIWDGTSRSAVCENLPDKESPLWASDYLPIYMWTGDEFDSTEAYYVGYNGRAVSYQNKWWGNPRHGFRCVRDPIDSAAIPVDTMSSAF